MKYSIPINEHELIRVKKTKFCVMYYDTEDRELLIQLNNVSNSSDDPQYMTISSFTVPINKIPQMIRGLFSCYQRFHGKKTHSK